MPASFCLRIAMIWLSEYRDVFIKNSFVLVYENSLLLTSTNFRGDYSDVLPGVWIFYYPGNQQLLPARPILVVRAVATRNL